MKGKSTVSPRNKLAHSLYSLLLTPKIHASLSVSPISAAPKSSDGTFWQGLRYRNLCPYRHRSDAVRKGKISARRQTKDSSLVPSTPAAHLSQYGSPRPSKFAACRTYWIFPVVVTDLAAVPAGNGEPATGVKAPVVGLILKALTLFEPEFVT
jgi:hypothetical protein